MDLAQTHLLFTILHRISGSSEHLAIRFKQEFDKPAEKKVETPYEMRMRERKEKELADAGEPVPAVEEVVKTPEQIAEEQ